MKDIIFHSSAKERRAFIRRLFKTELLDVEYVEDVISSAAQRPMIFGEYNNPMEWGIHYSWWNVLPLRTGAYQNGYIHDLFLLHELLHIANNVRGFNTHASWVNNKLHEEFEASLSSEMTIYDRVDWLREETFPFAILYDEAAVNGRNRAHYRRQVIVNGSEETEPQKLMQQYQALNKHWCSVWGEVAFDVEAHMSKVDKGEIPIEAHAEWLKNHMDDDGIPFAEQAWRFNYHQKKVKS